MRCTLDSITSKAHLCFLGIELKKTVVKPGYKYFNILASITTEQSFETLTGSSPGNVWHHAAWVYDGEDLKLYLDKAPNPTTIPITGYLSNNDVPMMIAGCCGGQFFIGCLDELRAYERALTTQETFRETASNTKMGANSRSHRLQPTKQRSNGWKQRKTI
ncbi:hypothetical protein LSAT2_009614 [Lamellibrachia satsuma]|nr:hypothetical protein LSAT2_009614 [Lamellibrachia satsuma]